MMGHTHMLGGAAAWLGLCCAWPQTAGIIVSGAAIATGAALAPDIDHERSIARSSLGPITHGLSWLVRTLGGGQRRVTHCLLGTIAVTVGLLLTGWPRWVAAAILAGWVSHLLLDACTEQGIPLLWPDLRRWGLPRDLAITTGGRRGRGGRRPRWPLERVLWVPALVAACAVAGWYVVVHAIGA